MSEAAPSRLVIESLQRTFAAQKHLADAAIAQLDESKLRAPLDDNTNSVCVIMKHLAGNLRSRFTDFLTTDGEKPWRDRDDEFVDNFSSIDHMKQEWDEGWHVLFDTLASLSDADLGASVRIRGEPHTVAVECFSGVGEGGLGARLLDGAELATHLLGEPDSVEASYVWPGRGRVVHPMPGDSLYGLRGAMA